MSPTLTDASPVQADPSDGLAALEARGAQTASFGIPLAVLAEVTHRCPLQCPYCSNPVDLERAGAELSTDEWKRVLSELAAIGVLQIHFSGGEPTRAQGSVDLVNHATVVGHYSNLITSAVLLTRDKLAALADAGSAMCKISFQGSEPAAADRVAGLSSAHAKKIEAARWTRELGLPLTVNAVMHRQNLAQLPQIIQMAVDLDADRLEVANVQYYGWALKNRAALMPTEAQIEETSRIVEEAQARLKGVLAIDYGCPIITRCGEEMHGRVGPAVLQHLAVRQGAAVPRRRDHHGPAFESVRDHSMPGSGTIRMPSTAIAAPAGCRSLAGAATTARSTSAAAAARPSR